MDVVLNREMRKGTFRLSFPDSRCEEKPIMATLCLQVTLSSSNFVSVWINAQLGLFECERIQTKDPRALH